MDQIAGFETIQTLLFTEPMERAIGHRIELTLFLDCVRVLRDRYRQDEPTLEEIAEAWWDLQEAIGAPLMACLLRFDHRWRWIAFGDHDPAVCRGRFACHDSFTAVWRGGAGSVIARVHRLPGEMGVHVVFETRYRQDLPD